MQTGRRLPCIAHLPILYILYAWKITISHPRLPRSWTREEKLLIHFLVRLVTAWYTLPPLSDGESV